MADIPILFVEINRILRVDIFHEGTWWEINRFNEKVDVVGHEAKRVKVKRMGELRFS